MEDIKAEFREFVQEFSREEDFEMQARIPVYELGHPGIQVHCFRRRVVNSLDWSSNLFSEALMQYESGEKKGFVGLCDELVRTVDNVVEIAVNEEALNSPEVLVTHLIVRCRGNVFSVLGFDQ